MIKMFDGGGGTLLRGDELLDLDPYAITRRTYTVRPTLKRWTEPQVVAHSEADNYVTTLSRLRNLRRYRKGWDGVGSLEASARSFNDAETFLGLLSTLSTSFRTSAMIYAPGTAVLTISSDNFAATIEFADDGTLAAIIDDEDGEHDLDLDDFNGQRIPPRLAGFLAVR